MRALITYLVKIFYCSNGSLRNRRLYEIRPIGYNAAIIFHDPNNVVRTCPPPCRKMNKPELKEMLNEVLRVISTYGYLHVTDDPVAVNTPQTIISPNPHLSDTFALRSHEYEVGK